MTLGLLILAGVVVGALLGFTGAGGSLLAVPILVHVAGVPITEAVALALAGVATAALSGLVPRIRARQVDWRLVALLGGAGIPGALLGSRLNTLAGATTLSLTIALAMVVAVVATLLPRRRPVTDTRLRWTRRTVAAMLAVGLGVGILTGFLGVGGGFLIVPALTLLTGLPTARVVAVSLGVIAINSLTGLSAFAGAGLTAGPAAVAFAAATLVASLGAAQLATRIGDRWIRPVFCLAAASAAAVMAVTAVQP